MITVRRIPGLMGILLLCALILMPWVAGEHAVAQSAPPRLDLAALMLVPGDLSGPAWSHGGAFMEDMTAEAQNIAAYRGHGTTSQQVATKLRGFGWERKYVKLISRPDGSDPANSVTEVRSYIAEFATADGAAAAFPYLQDISMVPTASNVPGATIGDQSGITKDAGVSLTNHKTFHSLDLSFRIGNLVAGVTLIAYPWHATFSTPDVATTEALGNVLAQRVASPPTPGTTIGSDVLRLGGQQYRFTTYDDAYYRMNGNDIPVGGETPAATKARVASYKDATDVYQLWQGIGGAGLGETLYGSTLLRFPSPDDAASWVENLATILKANPFYGDLKAVPLDASLGDQSLALTYAPGGGGARAPHAILAAVRVGADVTRVHIVPAGSGGVPAGVVAEVAGLQTTCLSGGACPTAAPVPPALAALIAGTLATPVPATPIPATPVASPAASPAAFNEPGLRRD